MARLENSFSTVKTASSSSLLDLEEDASVSERCRMNLNDEFVDRVMEPLRLRCLAVAILAGLSSDTTVIPLTSEWNSSLMGFNLGEVTSWDW